MPSRTPIIELTTHIEGKNAQVRLFADRIEWERGRGVSAGKIALGVVTYGTSLLATGVKGGKDAYDMVFLKNVTNVANEKDGLRFHKVVVQTASGGAVNSIAFRVTREEAAAFRAAILDAIQTLNAPQPIAPPQPVSQPAASTIAPPPPPPVSLPPANWYPDPDAPGQLRYWDGTGWTENRAPQ